MPPESDQRTMAGGVNQLLGLCLPSTFITRLQQGQRMDTDDVTGSTVDVCFVGMLPNGRAGVTLRLQAGDAAWAETVYDWATGLAVSLRTHEGPNPLYAIDTEVSLTGIPPKTPIAPRLSITFDLATGRVRLSCPTEPDRTLALLQSTDDCCTWTVVPGYEVFPCSGSPFVQELSAGFDSTFYRVEVR